MPLLSVPPPSPSVGPCSLPGVCSEPLPLRRCFSPAPSRDAEANSALGAASDGEVLDLFHVDVRLGNDPAGNSPTGDVVSAHRVQTCIFAFADVASSNLQDSSAAIVRVADDFEESDTAVVDVAEDFGPKRFSGMLDEDEFPLSRSEDSQCSRRPPSLRRVLVEARERAPARAMALVRRLAPRARGRSSGRPMSFSDIGGDAAAGSDGDFSSSSPRCVATRRSASAAVPSGKIMAGSAARSLRRAVPHREFWAE